MELKMAEATELKAKIQNAVADAVNDPNVDASPSSAKPIADNVIGALIGEILHSTNQEPFYKSRVFWGSAVSIAASALGYFKVELPYDLQGQITNIIVAAIPVIGGAYALYGRFVATKPLGK